MRYLIAESIALKPHLETAGELALQLKEDGHEVVFSWLGDALPWSDWHLPKGAALLGCSLERRVRRFAALLSARGVKIEAAPIPARGELVRVSQWAGSFHGDLAALKSYELDGMNLGMGVASSLISFFGDGLYSPAAAPGLTRQCLISAGLVALRAQELLLSVKPDMVLTFNGRFATAKPIVATALRAGVQVLRHERGCTFMRYEVFSDALHNFAYIRERIQQVWNNTSSEERGRNGTDFFERRRKGDGIGWYSFTSHQEQGRIPEKARGKKRVVYFSSSDDEYAAVTDAYEPGPWPNQISAVKDLIAACDATPEIELLIRVHPHLTKKSQQERDRWRALSGRNCRIIPPEETVDSYALLDSSDVAVSYGSTMGMEAAYWGKPSILLGPCSYAGTSMALEPRNSDELKTLIHSVVEGLPVVSRQACLPYGNYYMSYGKEFRFYQPSSLSDGLFLGDRLGWDPAPVNWLRKQGLGRFYRSLVKKWI